MLSRALPALVQATIYTMLAVALLAFAPDSAMAAGTATAAADGAPIASHPGATGSLLHLLGVLAPLTLVGGGLAIALESRLTPRDEFDA
ncbi:hypothetical protein [Demequina salsinemoris]|uniref:hypothetical protein n=1 Tax=Demequina salsinemoris TaxID=577470 RepID=UPI00078139D4|nr:hypothetical protein [Demequina salsinemoris]